MRSIGKTDKGIQRNYNEDSIFQSDYPVGNLPNLYIIADGMGGHKAGAFASEYAVDNFVEYVKEIEDSDPKLVINKGIERINHLLYAKSEEDEAYHRMGTTFVIATIYEDKLYIGNIGDSRLYIINDEIQKITKDHSLVEEMVHTGHITVDEAKNHPERHIITRALGIEPVIEVDIYEIQLKERDLILMCSDGLTNMLEDSEIYNLIQSQEDLDKKVESLINIANDNGGNDNISVILIDWQG